MEPSKATLIASTVSPEEMNRTGAIKIASWTLMAVTIAVFIARQITKFLVFRRLAIDDLFIFIATVFATGLSITTFTLANDGLGDSTLPVSVRLEALTKGYYASSFLYISAICFAKLSLVVLCYNLVEAQRLHRRTVVGFGASILLWTGISIFIIGFQCELPRPWEVPSNRCLDMRIFWTAYCIIDMTTEVVIITLSVYMVTYLRIRLSRKVAVVACFAPRALVISASLIRLIWLYLVTPDSVPQYRLWRPALMTQIQVSLSICTSCIPFMVPFFKGLHNNQHGTYSPTFRTFRMNKDHSRVKTPIWSRRQRKGKIINSWDSMEVASLPYDRVPHMSPQIPRPRPLSPLTPPRLLFSRDSTSRFWGHDPELRSLLQSNGVSSPIPSLPQNLLTQTFTPTRKAPSPPPRSVASVYSNNDASSAVSTPRTHRFSLFPPQRASSRSPQLHQAGFSPTIPPIRSLRPQSSATGSPLRSLSNVQAPKFSTAPQPRSPPPTNILSISTGRNRVQRRASAQTPTSPMGAALNNYFKRIIPDDPPPPPLPPTSASASSRLRNQSLLTPLNSSRTFSATSHETLRDELHLPRDSIDVARNLQYRESPDVEGAQNSPRIVIQSPR